MHGIIQLLPDHVANQIAAGEVIQRPASAVKELMENAVDAGASRIQVVIKDAGRTLVQVSDNGCGMNETDARMCFERHATSKIRQAEDLYRIFTKGFRGEALASIAAVAQVEVITRRAEDEVGTKIVIEASKVTQQEPVAVSAGTTFSMKNLFYNIPARRNFLKSDAVELKHIIEEFQRVALVHPGIEFSLSHNGDEIFQLPGGNLRQRIVQIYGKNFNEKLVPVEMESDLVKVIGFIVKPEFAKRSRGEQYFFVNHRFIKSSYLHHAVQNAYLNLISTDQHPGYFLYMEVDPARLDVNIHPGKIEVKFEDERSVYMMLQAAVRQSLGKFNIAPSIDFTDDHSIQIDTGIHKKGPVNAPRIHVDPEYNPFHAEAKKSAPVAVQDTLLDDLVDWKEQSVLEKETELIQTLPQTGITRLFGPYWMVTFDTTCMILHARRAKECVLFYRLQKQLAQHELPSQQVLFPENIVMAETDAPVWESSADVIRSMGFDFAYIGDRTWEFTGLPAGLPEQTRAEELVEDLIGALRETGEIDRHQVVEMLLSQLAYRMSLGAIKADEMQVIVEELLSSPTPTHTPAGLITFVYLTKEELEQKFDR